MEMIHRFIQDKLAIVGFGILFFLSMTAIMAPVFSPYDPLELNLQARLLPPNISHPMGTDAVGRDMLSRVMHGNRILPPAILESWLMKY
jgi:peptide/nickel transport system permease protein